MTDVGCPYNGSLKLIRNPWDSRDQQPEMLENEDVLEDKEGNTIMNSVWRGGSARKKEYLDHSMSGIHCTNVCPALTTGGRAPPSKE